MCVGIFFDFLPSSFKWLISIKTVNLNEKTWHILIRKRTRVSDCLVLSFLTAKSLWVVESQNKRTINRWFCFVLFTTRNHYNVVYSRKYSWTATEWQLTHIHHMFIIVFHSIPSREYQWINQSKWKKKKTVWCIDCCWNLWSFAVCVLIRFMMMTVVFCEVFQSDLCCFLRLVNKIRW